MKKGNMNINLELVTINHEQVPIGVREKLKFTDSNYKKGLQLFKELESVKEVVILSTCNRTEIYTYSSPNKTVSPKEILQQLSDFFSFSSDLLSHYAVNKTGKQAVKHLLEVIVGLRSQVLGECEILGQVKQAYQQAREYGATGRNLNYIFREAITVAKKIRAETKLKREKLSISLIAIEVVKKEFSNLQEKNILIIGAGKMARKILKNLPHKESSNVTLLNRTNSQAQKLVKKYDFAITEDFSNLKELAFKQDVVIASTSAQNYLLTQEDYQKANPNQDKKRIFVDLGLPRNLDPELVNKPEIELYNLDDLKTINNSQLKEINKIKEIIKVEVCSIQEWFQWQKIVHILQRLKEENYHIVERELKRAPSKEMSEFAHHLSKKLFNRIILNLKTLASQNHNQEDLVNLAADILLTGKEDNSS